jgi:hypothetical protein
MAGTITVIPRGLDMIPTDRPVGKTKVSRSLGLQESRAKRQTKSGYTIGGVTDRDSEPENRE